MKWLVWLFLGWTFWLGSGYAPQAEPLTATLRCGECGGKVRVTNITFEPTFIREQIDENSTPYFDSG